MNQMNIISPLPHILAYGLPWLLIIKKRTINIDVMAARTCMHKKARAIG